MYKANPPLDLVIFLTPPTKFVGGGIISIFSLAKESRAILGSNTEVVVSTYPGYKSYRKNDLFENDEYIYTFDEVIKKFSNRKNVLIHMPENDISMITMKLPDYMNHLKQLELQINILNQNIKLMPNEHVVSKLQWFTNKVTQTTAHLRYATQELSNQYNTPVHHLSVFIDPKNYKVINYSDKENIIAVSNDSSDDRKKILDRLKELKEYRVVEINNLTYSEYKDLISKAKFTFTFGEGFDGYYIESVFSGNIGLAVYNKEFFPDESYKSLPNIFMSYEDAVNNINRVISNLDNEVSFKKVNEMNYGKLQAIYSRDIYLTKLSNFYKMMYDFRPSKKAEAIFIENSINQAYQIEQDLSIIAEKYNDVLEELNVLKAKLEKKDLRIHELNSEISNIYSSGSWRLTHPLRKVLALFKKR